MEDWGFETSNALIYLYWLNSVGGFSIIRILYFIRFTKLSFFPTHPFLNLLFLVTPSMLGEALLMGDNLSFKAAVGG